jgi:negative regulator of flagellin synthesis FlgM
MNTIDRFSAQNVSRTYVNNTDAARPERADHQRQAAEAATPRTDSVSLSDDARSLSAAREAVQAAPDVREQKIAAIKQRVEDGTYTVPSHVLALKILNSQADNK